MKKWRGFLVLVGLGVISQPALVHAEEDFLSNLRLQYWTYGVDGRASVRGSSLDVDDADKILDGTNNGVILAGERLFDQWGLSMDLFLGKQSGNKMISSSENVDWELETSYLTIGAFRRFLDKEFETDDRNLALDGYAGVRPFSNYYKLEFNPYDPNNDKNRSAPVTWVDTFLGLRLKTALSSAWELELYGDVGGFGIGNGSELSVLVRGDVVWNVTPGFNVIGGYRFFDLDTENQSGDKQTELDLQMSGPTVGIQGRF